MVLGCSQRPSKEAVTHTVPALLCPGAVRPSCDVQWALQPLPVPGKLREAYLVFAGEGKSDLLSLSGCVCVVRIP